MNESGTEKETIPSRLSPLTTLIPNNEELIYWLISHDNFFGYFSYINSETSRSCPPFSYIFVCCNIFNIPCIYYDYKNNTQKLLMLTDNSVILGTQPAPTPYVHNSQWVQAPGIEIVHDSEQFSLLKDYVYGVVNHFRNDSRVLAWYNFISLLLN